jgi:hypothetical protein
MKRAFFTSLEFLFKDYVNMNHNTQENVEIIFVFQNFVKKIKKLFVLMNKMLVMY